MGDFTMPSLGADMDAGTVTQWLVKPGDEVHRGDIVAVVETEKSTIEVEIFENGVIEELVVPEGERVPVGAVLAHVHSAVTAPAVAAHAPAAHAPAARAPAAHAPAAHAPAEVTVPAHLPLVHSPVIRRLAERLGVDLATLEGSGPGGAVTRADVERVAARSSAAGVPAEVPAEVPTPEAPARPPAAVGHIPSSPLARRMAAELGVDLAVVTGTGPGGTVIERDVRTALAAPAAPAPAPAPAPTVAGGAHVEPATSAEDRQAAMRRAIGALMARSKREIPHYYLSTTIDVGVAVTWVEQANLQRSMNDRLVLPVLLLKATALALSKVPEMNGFYLDDAFVPSKAVHVGVAVSLRGGGVIAPAVHDTDTLSVDELMRQLRDLVGRARAGRLRSSEMSDPTITVTNLGDLGVESVFGVIYPPQVALVGFGQVTERAVARQGMIGVRPCVVATLSADHRVSDGHRGGRFLTEINRRLQEPDQL